MQLPSHPDLVVTTSTLVDIYRSRLRCQSKFYEKCWRMFGFPPTQVFLPKVSYMLSECLRMAHGKMASGDWIGLDLEVYEDRFLDPEQIVLAHPAFFQVAYLEFGKLIPRW